MIEMRWSEPPDRPSRTPSPITGTANEISTRVSAASEMSGNSNSSLSCLRTEALALTRRQLRERRSNMAEFSLFLSGCRATVSHATPAQRRYQIALRGAHAYGRAGADPRVSSGGGIHPQSSFARGVVMEDHGK